MMFDEIASTYDVLNRLLSLGIDQRWRRKAVSHLPPAQDFPKIKLLDIATGTGDFLISLAKNDRVSSAVGADMSKKMLALCEQKIERSRLRNEKKIDVKVEDMTDLSFKENTFEAVTISFGIRNVENTLKALKETRRVLKKKGRLIILELSIPHHFLAKALYLLYFRYVLPFIGGLVSQNFKAYRYLNQTVENFPQGENFCSLLKEAGFDKIHYETITLGIVTLYTAEK